MPTIKTVTIVALLYLAGLGAAGQFAKLAVPFPFVQAQYPEAGALIGWLLSLISLLGMIFGLVGGIVVARLGFVKPLIGMMLFGAALSWRQASLPGLPEMLALRLLEGMSHLAIVVAAPTLIGIVTPPAGRGIAMTVWSSFFGVTFALTALFGLPYVEATGLGALIRFHAIWMAVIALLLIPALRGVRPARGAPIRSLSDIMRRHVTAYSSARIAAPGAGWLFYTATFVAGLAILPPLVDDSVRDSVATAMPLVGIAISLTLIPFLLRRLPATSIVITGFFGATGVALTGMFGADLAVVCVALFAVLGLVQGASFAAVPQLNQDARDQALANGGLAQAGNLGNTLGTPVLLAVLTGFGLPVLMGTIAALSLLGAATHVLMARRRARSSV